MASMAVTTDLKQVDDFMNKEAPHIHDAYGGLSVQEDGFLKIPDHYKKLQPSIQSYLSNGVGFDRKTTQEEWEALYDDIAAAEAKANESDNGPLEVFNKMILKIGENSDAIDPWINLIPDSYGLCVVKSGFALLLNRASAHSAKRQAIFDAFIAVRDTIADASSRGVHFQSHSSVYRVAGDLYEAIVDAILELLAIVESRKKSKWLRTSRKKTPSQDPQEILKTIKEKANILLREVDNCRDAVIRKTGKDTQQTLGKVEFVCWKAVEIRESVSRIQVGQNKQLSVLETLQKNQEVQLKLSRCREESNEGLLEILRDQIKKDQDTISKLEWIVRQQLLVGPDPYIRPVQTSKAVVSLKRLYKILSSSLTGAVGSLETESDLDALQMRNNDLQTILSSTAVLHPISQSQAHSVFNHDRFIDWMHRGHPDFLFIDGNFQENATDSTSPMSLLCARFGLTIAQLEPQSVCVHFYCGLHVDPGRNNWYGPDAMIRSIVVQLLTALVDKDIVDIDFLNRRSYVKDLEYHDLDAFCDLLHDLVQQFDADTAIYCIVDGVSKFDLDFRGTFASLKVILKRIQGIVGDDELKPKLKVLMTVPFISSQRLRRIIADEFYMSLPSTVRGSRQLTEASIISSLQNPRTTSMGTDPFYQY
ncbi:hypothetical protein F53441_11189 [Fusarium austroafricanum]|uniref:Fungal STAND N-terminal Goodbye domain-containing protein n=1 Tax=Fusarium austroafricanum TaxID=2364996 RepID=A0A8H4K6A2_9HYPO|nr:hypothetical protein F53441_11189 [Fusarium austroafricanum]